MSERIPKKFNKGDKVHRIDDESVIKTVKSVEWQYYAGGSTSDYTVVFEEGGWDKSQNLKLI